VVTIPDILTALTASIWAEAGYGGSQRARNTTSIRRDLQRLYLDRLLRMVVTPEPGTPEDARTVARATLAGLSADLGRALVPANELDAYTQAHFADSRQRIQQALNAQVVQPLGSRSPTR
jgi:predicted ABC-class ATPase